MTLIKKFIALIFWSFVCSALARPIASSEVGRAAQHWLNTNHQFLGWPLDRTVEKITQNENQPFFIVRLFPEGFVIFSSEDRIAPVLAISQTGKYDGDIHNPLTRLLEQDLLGRLAAIDRSEKRQAEVLHQTQWNNLLSGLTLGGVQELSDVRVDPLIVSCWGQSVNSSGQSCFNYYTPTGPDGNPNNYVCGCLATSVAQVMRFYRYPTGRVGTDSFPIIIDGTTEERCLLGGDLHGGPYDWDHMPLNPNPGLTETEARAIGSLTFDVGLVSQMNYTRYTSTGRIDYAMDCLQRVFGYHNIRGAWSLISSPNNILLGFVDMVNTNLDAGYPVILGIIDYDLNNPHAVICDGYGYQDSISYYHLNMGWDGVGNVWYNLPDVDIYSGYKTVFNCLYNIFPTGSGEIISGRVIDTKGNPVVAAKVIVQGPVRGVTWEASTNKRGIYAFPNLPSNTTYKVRVSRSKEKEIFLGESENHKEYSGNVWAVDFTVSLQAAACGWENYE